MQKFNSINVEARFIKSILKNTYLPVIPTVREGDYIVEGVEYTYKNSIIRCTKSGILTSNGLNYDNLVFVTNDRIAHLENKASVACSDSLLCSESFLCRNGIQAADSEVIQTFFNDTFVPGLTATFTSSSDTYDIPTHKQLGKYLRWYRDTKNIDLMAMYNCFAGESTQFAHIKNMRVENGADDIHTSWIVPAQLNKTYTFFINSNRVVSIQGVFLNDFGRVVSRTDTGIAPIDNTLESDTLELNNTSYSHPFSYRVFTSNKELLAHNNEFYILVQTDKSHSGRIVVLEGDYTNRSRRVVTSAESIAYTDYLNCTPQVTPSISLIESNELIPYSDRLIEFMTQHAVSSEEDIPLNVARVQQSLGLYDRKSVTKDVWDDKLRFMLHNRHFKYVNDYYFKVSNPTQDEILKKGIHNTYLGVYNPDTNELVGLRNCKLRRSFDMPYDITGYVDKDIENTLFRYRSND